jgi:DNA mismatch repair ATPase MutS
MARLLPLLPLSLIALNVAGVVSYLTWVFAIIVTLTFSNAVGRTVHRVFDRAFSREGGFQEYAELIQLLERRDFGSPLLAELQRRLRGGEGSAQTEMRRLHRLVSLSEVRFSMLYVAIQGLTLWDFHVLDRLERWQLRAGRHAREWLGAVAEADALSALATLRFDNPDWAFPAIAEEGPPLLEASDLGHPLLRDGVRVVNDVTIPPPGRFLFITGSNMSGKSTLLRAIGTNVVLAQAGAPVCASAMRLPPLSLATSMRVHDSLQAGLSHFMAELTRLKMIVEAARQADARVLLYLLDDVLQGTNSAERRIAARKVVGHLLDAHAIGCVTSHDLALADEGRLAAAGEAVHFTERIEEGPEGAHISFDYRLRPGIATSRNALKLVELVGLSETERATGD